MSASQVIKLAERVIQFADARVLTSEGHLCLARALQASKDPGDMIEYRKAVELNPDQLLALLAQAQAFTRIGGFTCGFSNSAVPDLLIM